MSDDSSFTNPRDYFAAAGLPALIARHRADLAWSAIAPTAYEIADAMLIARDAQTKDLARAKQKGKQMSDDLVKRLREAAYLDLYGVHRDLEQEAAARIECLEAEVEGWKKKCVSSIMTLLLGLGVRDYEKADFDAIFTDFDEGETK